MIFKIFIQFIFICIIVIHLYGNTLSIAILCKKKLGKKLQMKMGNKFKFTNSLNDCDLVICDKYYLNKCLKLNKKVILINIYSYEINKYKNNKNIVAFFPIDCPLKDQVKFINKNLKNANNKCVIIHYKREKYDDVIFYYVKDIGDVPYKLNLALKNCDIIIALPDDVVFNYFSTRFIFKRVILNGKLIVGFNKEMISLGAVCSFDINYNKYFEKIKNFLGKLNKINFNNKIIQPDFNEFNIYLNKSLLK